MDIFNEKELVKILLPCLNISLYGLQIPLVVAQCLNTVSDGNPAIYVDIFATEVQDQLQTLMAIEPQIPEHVLLKTLAASIMMNTFSGKSHNPAKNLTETVVKITADTLSESIDPILVRLSADITSHKHVLRDKYRDENDLENKWKALNKTVDAADCLLKAKQVTLEILTNIYFCDDSSDEWDDISDSDVSESECIVMDIDDGPVTPSKLGFDLPQDMHSLIKEYGLIQMVIDQILIQQEITKVTSEYERGKVILKSLNTVRNRALLCFNNMLQCLTIEDAGGSTKLFDLWMNIANLLFKQSDFTNTEQLEAATSSMRAVLEKLRIENCSSLFANLSESDLQLLMNIYHQSQEGAVKVNVIRSLGSIGCLIGKKELYQSCHKLIQAIAVFLLEVASKSTALFTKSTDLWVTAESIDVMLDIFAVDHLQFIVQRMNLVEKLQYLHKVFKGKVKQQRKLLGEHLTVVMMVKVNLPRFIQYKREKEKEERERNNNNS